MIDHPELLSGILVLDMSQFLSGPYAALRLGDLGARVIKVERPDGGDLCRRLYLSDTDIGGDSTLFHAINRNKESITIDFKSKNDQQVLWALIRKADVIIQNFRPGVIERLGFDYASVRQVNPRIVYASISGYGKEGEWKSRPGQDLLSQSRSGLMWLNGDDSQGPVPFGLAIADMLAGGTVVQGVLAGLVRRGTTGTGTHIETSLLEVLIDLQFEVLTTYLNDGGRLPKRAAINSAHAYLAAPYGVYETSDGYLSLAMMPLDKLSELLELPALKPFMTDPGLAFTRRDDIKRIIAERLRQGTTADWLALLEPADIWCSAVLNWQDLLDREGFRVLDMLQTVHRGDGVEVATTRLPMRIDGIRPKMTVAAPRLGDHSAAIRAEFGLENAS